MDKHETDVMEPLQRFNPRPTEAYYKKVEWMNESQPVWNRSGMVWKAAAVVVTVLGLALAANPSVRAAIANLLQIGDANFEITESVPDTTHAEVIKPVFMNYEDAQAAYGYATPTYLPEGWTATPVVFETDGYGEAAITAFPDGPTLINLNWADSGASYYLLRLTIYSGMDVTIKLGDNADIREVDLGGTTAALYRGAWVNGSFQPGGSLTLEWVQDGLRYQLAGDGLSEDELIRIGASFE